MPSTQFPNRFAKIELLNLFHRDVSTDDDLVKMHEMHHPFDDNLMNEPISLHWIGNIYFIFASKEFTSNSPMKDDYKPSILPEQLLAESETLREIIDVVHKWEEEIASKSKNLIFVCMNNALATYMQVFTQK